jgi:flagellar protein FliO/FliZ
MNAFFISLTGFFLSGLITVSLADEPAKNSTPKTLSSSPIASGALTETLLGLMLILALIFVLAWLIKRTGRFQTTPNGEIKMLAGLSLGARERAVLLEVSGERILVGVTPQQIQTLHILNQNDVDKDHDKYAQFDQQLQSMIKKEQTDD